MNEYLLIVIIGYLFGCLQFAYFTGKAVAKTDIRKMGHGNAGASNVVESLGWKYGVAVAVLDILKAVVSVTLTRYLFPALIAVDGMLPLYLNGAGVIMGHNYPFFMKFKGGKGTASTVGMLLAIDYRLGLLSILVVLVMTIVSNYIVIGAMALLILLVGSVVYLGFGQGSLLVVLFISAQSLIKHLPNLKRIAKGEESGLRGTIKKK